MRTNGTAPKLGNVEIPHDIANEQCVLGCMLTTPEAADYVFRSLTEHDFYRNAHKLVFRAICALMDRDEPVDFQTLRVELEKRKQLDLIDGMPYLTSLFDTVPTTANLSWYVDHVRAASVRRDYLAAGLQLQGIAANPGDYESTEALMDAAEQVVFKARRQNYDRASGQIVDVNARVYEIARTNSKRKGAMLGMSTGYRMLDFYTKGLQKPRVYYIAARPSVGKTALALKIGLNASIRAGVPTLYITLETDSDEMGARAQAAECGVSSDRIMLGRLMDEEWHKLEVAIERMNTAPFAFDDEATSLPKLRARVRSFVREHGSIGLLIVDYIQIMDAPKADRRDLEIGKLTKGIKEIAKDFNIPAIVVSQLNREAEGQIPTLKALRESGSIEADANFILALHRAPYQGSEIERPDHEMTQAYVLKNRMGPKGMFELLFHGDSATYLDLAHHEGEPPPEYKRDELQPSLDLTKPTGF